MFKRLLLTIFVGVLTLMAAGVVSYTYLSQTVGPRDIAPLVEKIATPPVLNKSPVKATPAQSTVKKVASKTTTTKTNGALTPATTTTEKTIVTPGPLRSVTKTTNSGELTVNGIIERTNMERAQNGGLPLLAENKTLGRDAQMKVDDMFAKQYFEHVSPSGVGPADLALAVGYAYVIVGENLALGDFAGDTGLVTAWMNSPGHRANILNNHYQEIGVAVGRGMYEGHMTWLAVQSFGMPLSSCPSTDQILKAQIDTNSATIASLRTELDAKKAQIDSTPQSDQNYNTYVNEFNALVPKYNSLIETNRLLVANYNAGVQAFNACIASVSGH